VGKIFLFSMHLAVLEALLSSLLKLGDAMSLARVVLAIKRSF
jgi:hypothetical protein